MRAQGYTSRHAYGHIAELITPEGYKYTARITYYSRIWEVYRFQSVLRKVVSGAMDCRALDVLNEYRERTNRKRLSASQKAEILKSDTQYNELNELYNTL